MSARRTETDDACAPGDHVHAERPRRKISDRQIERASSIFRAVGDPARLRLLERLAGGEQCVTELAEAAGTGLSTVSQQLKLLRSEHIVTRRRAGKHIYYALADRHILDLVESAIAHADEAHGHDDDDD